MYPQQYKNSTNIKTWINDLRLVSGAIRAADMQVATIGAVDYATALDGLSLKQAQLMLTTQGIVGEEQKQILIQQGLIASSDRMSASLVSEALASNGLNKEKAESILIRTGLMNEQTKELITENAVTESKLRAILAEKGIKGAKADTLIASILQTGQNGKEAISWNVLGTSIAKTTKQLLTFLTTTPVGWAIIAVTAIASVTTALVTYEKELEETRQEMIETGKEASKLAKDLDGLIEQYRKLGKDGELDNSDREQAYSIQQQINELLGDEVDYINLSNGKYEEQLELLKKLQYQKAKDNRISLNDAKIASEESLENTTYDNLGRARTIYSSNNSIEQLLKDNNMEKYFSKQTRGLTGKTNRVIYGFKVDNSSAEAIIESFNKMNELKNILFDSYKDEINDGGELKDFYTELKETIDDMSDSVQKYKDAISDYNINEAVVQFNKSEFDGVTGSLIDSESAISKWMNAMMKSKNISDGVQAELIALAKTWYPQYIKQINASTEEVARESVAKISIQGITEQEIETLKSEAIALGMTEAAMMQLVLAEINFNSNNLNVSQKVSALKELATWAGVAKVKMDSILGASNSSKMSEKTIWAERNNVTINKYADQDGTHTYTYNGTEYRNVNDVNEVLLNEAIKSQIDKMNNIKVPSTTVTSSGGGGSSGSSKNTKETFDWIETAISRLQYAISAFGKTVSATWKSWTDRNSALKSQISAVTQEIKLQNDAAQKYLSLANSVGLSENYKKLVRNGSLDIATLTNESTINAIKKYKEYYETYLDCLDAKQDAEDELANLVREDFDLIAKQFDSEISLVEANISTLEAYIDQTEMKGNLVSKNYYSAMYAQEEKNLALLQKKYDELSTALSNDTIKQGSEEWNSMLVEIKDVKQEIIESTTALEEYQKTIRELDWEVFDLIQDKIGSITDESEFLIDLLSNSKLFNDDGSITSQGQTTLGLHVANMRIYESQIKDYADEIVKLDEEFANDSLDQNYLERREELLELQRDMILATQDERNSIKDLMDEGYSSLLSYMDELINKRKELLSQTSDARSFQKTVQEQTDEISRLQNIINSYGGDLSEESKSAIQKYEVQLKEAESNLEDTLYDQYISDQEKMLDALYD